MTVDTPNDADANAKANAASLDGLLMGLTAAASMRVMRLMDEAGVSSRFMSAVVDGPSENKTRYTTYVYGDLWPENAAQVDAVAEGVLNELIEALVEDAEGKASAVWRQGPYFDYDSAHNALALSCRVAFE